MFDIFDFAVKPEASEPEWMDKLRFEPDTFPVQVIRQSWLSQYRRCQRKGFLSATEDRGSLSYHLFGGNTLHEAIDDAVKSPSRSAWLSRSMHEGYWQDIFERIWEKNPRENYNDDVNFDRFRSQLVDPSVIGVPLGGLINLGLTMLESAGYVIRECEKHMVIEPEGGVPYSGTIDLVMEHREQGLVIADTKTSGMWNRYFRGKSITKQTYSTLQVASHLQLTHYSWMGWRTGDWDPRDIGMYMIFTPANLTKSLRGANKGMFKGPPFHFGKPHPNNVARYEEDIISWLKMAASGMRSRMYPSVFGKLDCEKCPYRTHCFEDKASEEVPDYLRGGMS